MLAECYRDAGCRHRFDSEPPLAQYSVDANNWPVNLQADLTIAGGVLAKQNDEWSLNRRYMQLEGLQSLSETAPTRAPAFQR
ncbi:MAG: hypothetical protein IPP44_08680 [Ideonella sp.]|nr:hypothetical protein [Ideonella sp.]